MLQADGGISVKLAVIMPLGEQRGGGELMLWHLCQQGRGLGITWLVIFLEDGPMAAQVAALGIDARTVRAGHLRQPHCFLGAVRQILTILRQERADAVVGWMSKAHLYGSLAAKRAHVPALWYQLGIPHEGHWMDRLATRLPARGILTCSQAGADAQARLKPRRPLRVVHPGVELERFNPSDLPAPADVRRQLGLPDDGPVIGIVGRLQQWKGMHVLIEAMPRVLQTHPDAHCVVVGGAHAPEPDYPAFLAERIKVLGLSGKVTMAGLQRNVPLWMQAMDIVVHASDREPFGIVIIEAMALGKPVIAGDAAGPTEIITDGVDGLLAPYGDPDALACALLRLLDDAEAARRMGAAARRRAQAFSTQLYARNFVRAVRSLLEHEDTTP